jgi:deazaflavin-dependent oxidoreductase (nitroreductase family)
MSVELTPPGTRGVEWPKIPGFLMSGLFGLTILAYRILGDRMKIQHQPLILVTSVGGKTGKTRQTLLCRFPEGDGYLIVASAGGTARHPAWYFNMARNPDKVWIEIGGRTQKVQPESLRGDERAAAFGRISALVPVYAGYQVKTDREIPVVRLTPETL